jgi:hypothetical protein
MKEILNFTSSRYPEVLLQDLTPLKKVENSKGYNGCFAHKWSIINKFVYKSNLDLSFKILDVGEEYKINFNKPQAQNAFNTNLLSIRMGDKVKDNNPVFQIETDMSFICKDKVFIEMQQHPDTPINLKLITGKFDISQWVRPLNCAFEIKNQHQEIVIKRGDPLAIIAFYSNKINDTYKLKKIKPSQELINLSHNNTLSSALVSHVKALLPYGQTLLQQLIKEKKHVKK